MDWAGARQMRKKAGDDVVTIYLLPPSIKELRERLVNRGTDSKEVIEKEWESSLIKSAIGTNLIMLS